MKTFPTTFRGFTFTEIMFVVLIMGFVSMGLYRFIIDTSKSIYTSTEKNDIANNIRQFTGEMESVAKSANVAYVYKTFQPGDRTSAASRMQDGQSGDCVVFITMHPDPNPLNPDLITKIVGYFRRPNPSDPLGRGPVLKFQSSFGPGVNSKTYTPEALISGLSYDGDYPEVVQLAKGMSSGSLFYNYMSRSIMIKAQIVQGNNSQQITNTYNFTISPRG